MTVNEQAIETVAIHMAGESRKPDNFYEYPYNDSDRVRHREKARAVLEAAMPHIREQIADELRAELPKLGARKAGKIYYLALMNAADIVEGKA